MKRPRRDERLISAIAIVGRGLLLVVLVHESARAVGIGMAMTSALAAGVAGLAVASAAVMVIVGPCLPKPRPTDPRVGSRLDATRVDAGNPAPTSVSAAG